MADPQNKAQKSLQSSLKRAAKSSIPLTVAQKSYKDTGKQSFADQALDTLKPLKNIGKAVLNVANRPAQTVLRTLHGDNPLTGLKDITGEHDLDVREALGLERNAGGLLGGAADLAASVALDPLTYLSFGTSGAAKAALSVAGKHLGKEALETVAKGGLKSLPAADVEKLSAKLATEEGGQKFADKIIKDLSEAPGVKFAGKTVLPSSVVSPVTDALKTPLRAAGDTRIGSAISDAGKSVKDALTPRADIIRKSGRSAADQAGAAASRSGAIINNASRELEQQLSMLQKAAKVSPEELKSVFLPAAEKGAIGTLAKGFRDSGQTEKAQLAQKLEELSAPQESLGQQTLSLGETAPSLPDLRTPTDELKRQISRNPERVTEVLGPQGLSGFSPELGVAETSQRLSKALGLKGEALETNPVKVLFGKKVAEIETEGLSKHLSDLADITVGSEKLGKFVPSGQEVSTITKNQYVEQGLTPVSAGKAGTLWAPKDIADEAKKFLPQALSTQHASEVGKLMDSWTKLWKGYATVPVLFGLGFHARNLQGNIFNMAMGGFKNPKFFSDALKTNTLVEKGLKKGLSLEEAIGSSTLSPQQKEWAKLARDKGVIGESFYRTDLNNEMVSFLDKNKGALNPLSTRNVAVRSGAAIGRGIEDMSRMAMFMSEMAKHGNSELAAANVKKYLFDYADLTKSEQAIRRVVPFWTFMRKNTPLQAEILATSPKWASWQAAGATNLEANAPSVDGKVLPEYALAAGQIPLAGGDNPILGGIQTPLSAAGDAISPLAGLAALATGKGGRAGVTSQDVASDFVGNLGGGAGSLAKAATEVATGHSSFSGAPVTDPRQQILKALLPQYSKGQSTTKALTNSDTRKAGILSALTGLQTTAVTPGRELAETYRRQDEIQAANKKGKAKPLKSGRRKKAS